MGILEFIGDEHAGIIPRAISQIFAFAKSQDTVDISITLSFLQLYRETIQDLLAPATNSGAEDNLVIREDPETGFYVVGLQEFSIRTYREAGNSCS